jgi:DNA-binding LacI/PurR family transcriptional regulator
VYAFEDPATIEFLRGLADAGIALRLVPATGGEGDSALVLEAAVDAFIVYALPDGHPLVDAIMRRRLPVIVQSGPELPGLPLVAIDECAAAAAAADHLHELGHTRLAVLSLPFSLADRADRPLRAEVPAHRVTRGRLAGYGVSAGREVAVNDREHGEAAAGVLLDGLEPPTGLLCMSDELAIGALSAAAARGIAVPGELSIVGWDDTPEARRADPPLTTIRQSLRDQGRRCAELAAAGAGGPVEPQPWELIIRGSTEGFRPSVR